MISVVAKQLPGAILYGLVSQTQIKFSLDSTIDNVKISLLQVHSSLPSVGLICVWDTACVLYRSLSL